MSEPISDVVEQFKDLSDIEFEILFIDDLYKKLKKVDRSAIRSESLLLVCLTVVDTLKKFKLLSQDGNRTIPHEDVIDAIIAKNEAFLTKVANDESQAMYTSQSVSDTCSFVSELLLQLKKELVETPKYAHLKR